MPTPLRRLCRFDRGLLYQLALAGVALALLAELPIHAQMGEDGAQDQAQIAQVQAEQGDPPSEVARLSVANGNVSVEPASVDQFSQAESNHPLTTGDRVYDDAGATTEIETGQLAVRLGQQTDLTVTAMTDTLAQFGLAQGSVHLRSFGLEPGVTVELDTPNVAVTVLQLGDVRVDVDPESNATTVWLISGQVQVDGNGLQQTLEPGQRVRLEGSDPVSAQWLNEGLVDGLDRFSADRDELYASSIASEAQDVNPEVTGAADLSANGDWETDTDDGPVWFPSGVAVGWVPYSCGRWAWVAPWGWTWVGCETWGFAPFHYGRWEHRRGRWGWIPGPPVVRPIYSPAMVAFVGGSGLTMGGAGVTAWFPLGPHEPYVPWYQASLLYLNRVNVSNIYNPNAAEVRSLYNQRADASVYAAAGERGYVNRPLATVAVSQASFAAGKPVARSMVHVAPEQLAAAPVLAHPMVTPERTLVVSAPARAVPARMARPTLASRTDEETRPAEEPVAPVARSSMVRPQAEQTPVSTTPAAQRPLFHNAVPPAPRPSFDEQQKAIQTSDPGRPLGSQQMENLRDNRPAGPPQQRETPHPAPAPRYSPPPGPAPRSAPAPAAGNKH